MTNKALEQEKSQIVRGMLEVAVLANLEKKPLYGAKLLIALADTPFASRTGTLYPLLNRMQKQGLIDAEWKLSPDSPPKKYYSITAIGLTKLTSYRELLNEIYKILGGNKK